MAQIYTMSDIHGHYTELLSSLENINLNPKNNKLIFLGDYVDNGKYSYQVLNKLRQLEMKYPQQVITLLGNHDEWFYDWLFTPNSSFNFNDFFETINSFIGIERYSELFFTTQEDESPKLDNLIRHDILQAEKNHLLLNWFKQKYQDKRYFVTESQIFVHAGIDEEMGKFWETGTAEEIFTNKYPPTTGEFFKTIISGHVHSDEVAQNAAYLGKVFWDKQSHFFIDGNTDNSNVIPILKYDTEEKSYSSYKLENNNSWTEYCIK